MTSDTKGLELGKAGIENALLCLTHLLHVEEHLIEKVAFGKTELTDYLRTVRKVRQKLAKELNFDEENWCVSKHLLLALEYAIESVNKGSMDAKDYALIKKLLFKFLEVYKSGKG